MIRRREDIEVIKIGQVVGSGQISFTSMEGETEKINIIGPDPSDPDAYIAERLETDKQTRRLNIVTGRIKGVVREGGYFLWEHKVEEASGVATTAMIGIAVRSLYKHYHKK